MGAYASVDLFEDTMKLTKTGFDVGYGNRKGWHLQVIPKGDLGSLTKIQEEFLEYVDACDQGLFLCQAFELSDMVGALAAYLWARKIPFDIAQPSEQATTRALLLRPLSFARAIHEVLPSLETPQLDRVQYLAETILILIFSESTRLGLPIKQLLAQAQMRSAIAQNE